MNWTSFSRSKLVKVMLEFSEEVQWSSKSLWNLRTFKLVCDVYYKAVYFTIHHDSRHRDFHFIFRSVYFSPLHCIRGMVFRGTIIVKMHKNPLLIILRLRLILNLVKFHLLPRCEGTEKSH